MSHIFISYSRKDLTFAQRLVDALAAQGLDTWIDWKSIPKGEDWEQEIYRGIEGADAFLFLISSDSVQSEMCNKEIACAVKNGKRILPIFIANVEDREVYNVTEKFLHQASKEEISRRNFIKCREGRDNFEKAIEEVRTTIHIDYEWLKIHTDLQLKALEWANHQDTSRLLRGKELQEAELQLSSAGVQKDPQPTSLQRQYILVSRRDEEHRRRLLTSGLTAGMIVLIILSVIALGQRNVAVSQKATAQAASTFAIAQESTALANAKIALSRQLAAQAANRLSEQPDLALLLSLESFANADTFESRDILLKSILHTPRLAKVLDMESTLTSVDFSPDGHYLVAGSSDGSIEIWKAESWERIASFKNDFGPVMSASFNSDSSSLVVVYCNDVDLYTQTCRFVVWSMDTQTSKTLSPVDAQWPATFSMEGNLLAFSAFGGLQLWDISTDQPIGSNLPIQYGQGALSLIFSPDNHWLLAGECSFSTESTGCFGGVIEGWDISDMSLGVRPLSNTLGEQGNAVLSLAFDSSGTYLASGSCMHLGTLLGNCPGGEVNLWNFWYPSDHEAALHKVGVSRSTRSGPIDSLALSYENGGILAASGNDNLINLYTESNSTMPESPWDTTTFVGSKDTIIDNALSPNGHWLAAAGGNTVTLWEINPVPVLEQKVDASLFWIKSVSFVGNDRLLAASSTGNIWDIELGTGKVEDLSSTYQGSEGTVITPGGNPVALINKDNNQSPQLVDLKTNQPISPPLEGIPDSGFIAGMPRGAYAISSDQAYFAASGNSQVVLWDLKSSTGTGVLKSTPLEGSSGGMSLAFSHDGRYLAAGGEAGGVTIWNVADRSVVDALSSGSGTAFTALAFSPDDRILAAAICNRHEITDEGGDICSGSEIRLWNMDTRQPFGPPLPEIPDFILALSFDSSGNWLIVFPFNSDGYEVWDFKIADWIPLACNTAGRNFTQAEWTQYFPDEPYHITCPQWPAGK